jgi:hypothetical protein
VLLEIYLIGLLLSTVYASKTLYDNTVNYNARYTKNTILWFSIAVLAYPIIGLGMASLYTLSCLIKLLDKVNDQRL